MLPLTELSVSKYWLTHIGLSGASQLIEPIPYVSLYFPVSLSLCVSFSFSFFLVHLISRDQSVVLQERTLVCLTPSLVQSETTTQIPIQINHHTIKQTVCFQ